MALSSRKLRSYSLQNRRLVCCCAKSENGAAGAVDTPVRMVAVVGGGTVTPLKSAAWYEVMVHTATRLKWAGEGYEMLVFTDNFYHSDDEIVRLRKAISSSDILMIVAVTDRESVEWIRANSLNVSYVIVFASSRMLENKIGGSLVQTTAFGSLLGNRPLPQSKKLKESEVVQSMNEAWSRHNSDDIRFCLLVIINAYIRPVPILQNLRAKGFYTLNCMVTNCGRQILICLLDPKCRKALQCLNNFSPVDQVCNYRCIASYESPELEEFSLCVLQKHSCLQLDHRFLIHLVLTNESVPRPGFGS